MFGANDATLSDPRSAGEKQRQAYSGSRDASLVVVPEAGHAITLERSAPRMRALVHDWLTAHGL